MAERRDVIIEKGPSGYGFNLARMGGINFFRVVEPNSPAQRAGINPGDMVIKVNGQDVTQVPHQALVMLMRQAGEKLRLCVQAMSKDQLEQLKNSNQFQDDPASNSKQPASTFPVASGPTLKKGQERLVITRTSKDQSFGFNLSKAGGRHFLRVVQPDGIVARSGARPGDEIISINGQLVKGMEHSSVVQLIKDSGNSIELVVLPESAAVHPSEAPTRDTVNDVIQADANRIRKATDDARAAREAQRKASLLEATRLRELRRQEQFEHDKKIIEDNLLEAKQDAEKLKARMKTAREAAQKVATPLELKGMQDILNSLRERELGRLKDEQSIELPEDQFDRQVELLRREMQRSVIEQEIFAVQAAEWTKFCADCNERRKEEERQARDEFERTKEARKRDLDFLRQKEERMKKLLQEAEEKRQREIEEAARCRREKEEQMRKEAEDRAKRAQQAAHAREEQRRKDEELRLQRLRIEEEAKHAREEQEREETYRRERLQQRLDEEEEERQRKNAFGVQLKRRVSDQKPSASHPMIGHMAQRKGAPNLLNIPLMKGMKDTAM